MTISKKIESNKKKALEIAVHNKKYNIAEVILRDLSIQTALKNHGSPRE